LKARAHWEAIEWIPFNHLRNIEFLAEGGFSVVYKAIWLSGKIVRLNGINNKWKRRLVILKNDDHENAKNENIRSPLNKNEKKGYHVVIKSLNNSSNINKEFLNEVN